MVLKYYPMEELNSLLTNNRREEVRISGFAPEELLSITADSIHEAYFYLGESESKIAKQVLRESRIELGETNWGRMMETCEKKLAILKELSNNNSISVEGVNYLGRYIEALEAYGEGAGVTMSEITFLQIDFAGGCQSMMLQDSSTGEVRLLHTEEDMDYAERGQYRYRMVDMNVDGKRIKFFAYPGVCGWGPAFSFNETTGLIEMVDDLYIEPRFDNGPIWANCMVFMMVDAGELEKIKRLIEKVHSLPGDKFVGGYAVHMVHSVGSGQVNEQVKTLSVEFAGDKIRYVGPAIYQNRLISAQANCPIDEGIKLMSSSAMPSYGEEWTKDETELYIEMNERRRRLLEMGIGTDWLNKSPMESIKTGLRLLANPYGDVGRYIDDFGHVKYYCSALPSRVTVAHITAYISNNEISLFIGKGRPTAIPGLEYSAKVTAEYQWGLKKIWDEAANVRRDFYSRAI